MSGKRTLAKFVTTLAAALAVAMFSYAPVSAKDNAGPDDLDFFLGDWDIVTKNILPDGSFVEGRAQSRAYRFLDGAALMDEWRSLGANGDVVFSGASFRTWLPSKRKWRIVWMMAHVEGETIITGQRVDGEFHMTGEGSDPAGVFLERARYYDITENGFRFTMDRSYDGGETWISPFSEFTATRRGK